jgi:hypothetical protein
MGDTFFITQILFIIFTISFLCRFIIWMNRLEIYRNHLVKINSQLLATFMDNTDPETNFSYYHEYCRLYLANVVLLSQMRELANERNELTSRFSKL